MAIELGYTVRILVSEYRKDNLIHFKEAFNRYGIENLIELQDYLIPSSKVWRITKGILLTGLHFNLFFYLIAYCKEKKGFRISNIYEFLFFIRYRNIDIFHIQYGTNKNPLDILKKINFIQAKLIVSFHGHDCYFPIHETIQKEGYYDNLFKYGDYSIANTPFLKELILNLGAAPEKVELIPAGVDTEKFTPGKKVDKGFINLLTVGRLDELKGQEYGVEAVKILLEKGFKVHYNLVGTGTRLNYLERKVKDLGLSKYVSFLGPLSQEEVVGILQESDIFLMTSITDSNGMAESQGLVTAEAQSCGMPVVAFSSGGVKYTLMDGETGFLVREKDVSHFAECLAHLIDNKPLRVEMGVNARSFILSNFSRNVIKEKWRLIYES